MNKTNDICDKFRVGGVSKNMLDFIIYAGKSALDIIENAGSILVFGAQATACGVARALIERGKTPAAFLISSSNGNPSEIYKIAVCELDEYECRLDSLVVVAAPQTVHREISQALRRKGFDNILLVDSNAEHEILSDYFHKVGRFALLEDLPCADNSKDALDLFSAQHTPDVRIYRINSANDLEKPTYETRAYTFDIMAGAALSDSDMFAIKDNVGNHISHKNRDYCELSATYWVWKNVEAEYKGICHYRRYLRLIGEDFKRLRGVDAVLPLPFINYPNAKDHFLRYNSCEMLEIMLALMKAKFPRYHAASARYFEQEYTYNYNILIAKEDVFNDYSKFMFDLLFALEHVVNERDVKHEPRYIGYVGEMLTSLYFMVNLDGLKLAHAARILNV